VKYNSQRNEMSEKKYKCIYVWFEWKRKACKILIHNKLFFFSPFKSIINLILCVIQYQNPTPFLWKIRVNLSLLHICIHGKYCNGCSSCYFHLSFIFFCLKLNYLFFFSFSYFHPNQEGLKELRVKLHSQHFEYWRLQCKLVTI